MGAMEEEEEEEEDEAVPVIRLVDDEEDLVGILLRPPPHSPSPDSHLLLIASSSWLSRLSYFPTDLPPSSPRRSMLRLTLTCEPTYAYFRCLLLLKSMPVLPRDFDSLDEGLALLPVATHLGFDECIHACLEYLGAIPWSIAEEDAIRKCLDALGLCPTGALRERLDTSQDSRSLMVMLFHILNSHRFESICFDVVQKCLHSYPHKLVREFSHQLSCFRAFHMSKLSETGKLHHDWFTATKLLLELTDARQSNEFMDVRDIVCELIDSEALSACLIINLSVNHKDTTCILTQAFEKVHKGVVPLSISQRAKLVKQYGQFGQVVRDASFNDALRGVINTLPVNHPVLLDLMQSKHGVDLISIWFDRLLNRELAPELRIPQYGACSADDDQVTCNVDDVLDRADAVQVSTDDVNEYSEYSEYCEVY